jgi:glycosyltransferase involved in cell wall biosynthesis
MEENISKVSDYLGEHFNDFEILIVENQKGSPTALKAEEIASEDKRIRHIHAHGNGKGSAVEKSILESRQYKVGFMDADLATDIEHTVEAVEKLDDYNFVIGSRTGEGADRNIGRKVPSLVFNNLLKLVFNSKINDHQCGFKFFRRQKVEEIMDEVKNKHFFWDAELLVRAQRQGISIYELEVNWKEEEGSNVNVFLDGLKFFSEIIRLKKDLITE